MTLVGNQVEPGKMEKEGRQGSSGKSDGAKQGSKEGARRTGQPDGAGKRGKERRFVHWWLLTKSLTKRKRGGQDSGDQSDTAGQGREERRAGRWWAVR